MNTATQGAFHHASCVVVGEAGVLIRGPSGSGKSTLAREILDLAGRGGGFARLVGDDRVSLAAQGGRLVAKPHPAIAGRVEVRGMGIRDAAHADGAVVRLVVDCGLPRLDRMPDKDQMMTDVMGIKVRRVVAGPGQADRVLLALGDAGFSATADGTKQGSIQL
jgi:HPr kinase/phosphorylase